MVFCEHQIRTYRIASSKVCFKILIIPYKFLGPAAFRPRAHVITTYTPLIEKGRPVLQGLLAIDYLTKEVISNFNNNSNRMW